MTIKWQHIAALATVFASAAFFTQTAVAQGGAANDEIEEVVSIGTRSNKPRSAADSTVPIDVISGEDFNALGNAADLTAHVEFHGLVVSLSVDKSFHFL